ncbi:MAG: TaqI-like C-terminal specificity domain-containing protein [Moraxella sp.]|nr:TaqI-like C-terminal specificity domain-containing protein [Moraxella sp.]
MPNSQKCSKTRGGGEGFDVVIGKTPYVSHVPIFCKDYLKYKKDSISTFCGFFILFYELSEKIMRKGGVLSLITSNSFLKAEYGRNIREYLCKHTTILEVINIENTQIFSDATVNTVILSLQKDKLDKEALIVSSCFKGNDFMKYINDNKFYYSQNIFSSNSWGLQNMKNINIINKIKDDNKTLEHYSTKIRLGIATGDNNVFVINDEQRSDFIKKNEYNKNIIKPILRGRDIERYYYNSENLFLLLTKNGVDVKSEYPDIYEYLDSFGDKFKKRGAKGEHWSNLRACSFFDDFKLEKIVWIELSDRGRFTIVTDEIYLLNSAYFLLSPKEFNSKFLLSLLNSKLIEFYLKHIANTSGAGTLRWINNYVKDFPIPEIPLTEQQPFIDKADTMLALNGELQSLLAKFGRMLCREFGLDKLSKRLGAWHTLDFDDFIKELDKELKKHKQKLTLSQKAEWEDYFVKEQAHAHALQQQINTTDDTLNAMVYALYGLGDDEIALIEQGQ